MSANEKEYNEGRRLTAIDSLRGLALLGVIIMNVGAMAMRFAGREIGADAGPTDFTVMGFLLVLVQGKARCCFALLFGFGVATLMARAAREGGKPLLDNTRRMAALFLIGMVNQAFLFWGDILVLYSIVGLVAGAAFLWPTRRLLVVGLALALVPPLVLGTFEAMLGHALPSFIPFDKAAQAARGLAAVTSPSYFDMVAFSATQGVERRMADPFGMLIYDLNVVGLALVGMWVARRGLLVEVAAHRAILRRVATWCLPIGLMLSCLTATKLAGVKFEGLFGGVITAAEVAFPIMAFGYLASLALLLSRGAGPLQSLLLAPAGRMTLTNYLLSGAIGCWLFYGYGLALLTTLSFTGLAALGVALFTVLALVSRVWLLRFKVGPAEWIWRWLATGEKLRLRVANPRQTEPVAEIGGGVR